MERWKATSQWGLQIYKRSAVLHPTMKLPNWLIVLILRQITSCKSGSSLVSWSNPNSELTVSVINFWESKSNHTGLLLVLFCTIDFSFLNIFLVIKTIKILLKIMVCMVVQRNKVIICPSMHQMIGHLDHWGTNNWSKLVRVDFDSIWNW